MVDIIITVILVAIIGVAIIYIVKAKKNGAKCIGCPAGGNCTHKQKKGTGCGCGGDTKEQSESSCCCHTDDK
jgi:hypothetical protein